MKNILKLLLCVTCFVPHQLMAQTQVEGYKYNFDYRKIVPGMPENASLGSYGNLQLTSGNGLPDVHFNLYTVEKDGVSVPISIVYDASGIKYSDIPSAVGLKWSLDAGGSVNRSVNGRPDEKYLLYHLNEISDSAIDYENSHKYSLAQQSRFSELASNKYDRSLDYFYYNFPGHSGEMYINKNGKFTAGDDYTKLKIDFPYHLVNNVVTYENRFVIKDENGNTYFFESSYDRSQPVHPQNFKPINSADSYSPVAWKLKKILTLNKQEINFEYEEYSYSYIALDGERFTLKINEQYNANCPAVPGNSTFSTTTFNNTAALLKRIYTDDEEVIFIYTTDSGLPIWKRNLSSITIKAQPSGTTIKTINFNQGGTNYLQSFEEISTVAGVGSKKYSFSYNGSNPLTPMSKDRDIYGYYNYSYNPNNLIGWDGILAVRDDGFPIYEGYPFGVANRNINAEGAAVGTLSEITYPTGGKTQFSYEYNTDTAMDNTPVYAPGLRVAAIKDIDLNGTVYNQRQFSYRQLYGTMRMLDLVANLDRTANLTTGVINSEHKFPQGISPIYQDILIKNISADKTLYTREQYNLGPKMYGGYKPLLRKKIEYVNDTLHVAKATSYQYQIQGLDDQHVSTYILANPSVVTGGFAYEDGTLTASLCNQTIFEAYDQDLYIRPIITTLIGESTVSYSGNDSLIEQKTYEYYAIPAPILTKSVQTQNSDGVTSKISYYYPTNYPANSILKQMTDSNAIAPIVLEQLAKNNITKFEKTNNYAAHASGGFIVSQQIINYATSGEKDTLNYYLYDSKANVLETGKANDIKDVYLWGYNGQYPVAKIVGSNYATVSSVVTQAQIDGAISNDQTLRTLLNTLRTDSRTAGAMVSTYTYKPLVGITSETDAKGKTTYYEYDGLGRLKLVKDQNGMILKQYDYQYQAPVTQ